MKYFIVQDWPSTHGNHAGMVHMCKLLCQKYPGKYKMFVKECAKPMPKRNWLMRKIMHWHDIIYYKRKFISEYIELCQPMLSSLTDKDEIFLMEYHLPALSQYDLAKAIREKYTNVKIYALSHLTPTWYQHKKGGRKMILKWEELVDKQLTLGSSLTKYFVSLGIQRSKISTGFHYVDSQYYKEDNIALQPQFTIIAMGALQRDYSLLASIVNSITDVHWIICKGKKNVDGLFNDTSNVEIKGYVSEDELRELMRRSDFSLNVLEDTVGSNVITTSMAMGLGLFVSDVGSIRDYCDESNACFCDNTVISFVDAINVMKTDKVKQQAMMKSSLEASKRFSIEETDKWFDTLSI